MGSAAVAAMAPKIREVLDAPSGYWCAHFTVTGMADAWLQVTREYLNFAYPLQASPEEALRPLLARQPQWRISEWEPGESATVAFVAADSLALARAADVILTGLFGLADYSVDAEVYDLKWE